jgi:deoxycytidine triphosphate deaminase
MKHIMGSNSKSSLTAVQDQDVQPNAVDLRLGGVFKINEGELFEITNDHKKHRGSTAVQPDSDGFFELAPGQYEVAMENIITVGEGEAGWVITRSTLNRNGCFLTSGLYDTGYKGPMMAVLHVTAGPIRIKQGTRIGQYLNFNAESLHMYNGSYGYADDGKPKPEHTKLYGDSV